MKRIKRQLELQWWKGSCLLQLQILQRSKCVFSIFSVLCQFACLRKCMGFHCALKYFEKLSFTSNVFNPLQVYDAMTFEYKSNFLVETLAHPSDLAATKEDLFVFDNRNLTVHKVELSTKYSVNWSIQLKNRYGGTCSSYGMLQPDLALNNTYSRSICGPGGCANGYKYVSNSLAHDFSQVALSFSFYKSVSKGFSLTPKGTVLLISPSNFQREIIEFTGDGRVLRELTLSFFVHEPRSVVLFRT